MERRRDGSGRVHSSAEEALTFEKRFSSPTAIYPAFPGLLLLSLRGSADPRLPEQGLRGRFYLHSPPERFPARRRG